MAGILIVSAAEFGEAGQPGNSKGKCKRMKSMIEEMPRNSFARHHSGWTEDELRALVKESKDGIGFKKIVYMLARSRKSVSVNASRFGLTARMDTGEFLTERHRRHGKLRNCLSCASMFYSTDFGNRMCQKCKNSCSWSCGGDYITSI